MKIVVFSSFPKQIQLYKKQTAELEKQGWKVLIIWECQLKKKFFDSTMEQLTASITGQSIPDEKIMK